MPTLAPEQGDAAQTRRVLMICFAYPPTGGVGMIRSFKFATHLPEFGFLPTVVTPERARGRIVMEEGDASPPGVTVCRTPYGDVVANLKARLGLRFMAAAMPSSDSPVAIPTSATSRGWRARARRAAYAAVTTPDEHIGWRGPALAGAAALCRRETFNVVYSTSPPETTHLVARALKRRFGLPWVADLRDLWSDDHFRQRGGVKLRVLRMIERRVLADADVIVTVSEPWRETLARKYEDDGRRVVCIPHGFDPADYRPAPRPDTRTFSMVYTGSLDRQFQDPEPFLRTVGELVRTGRIDPGRLSLRFHVFGDNQPDLDHLAARHGLGGSVLRLPPLDYAACLAAQQAATTLLIFQWQSRAGEGNPPLKAYDYIGARRPILVVGNGARVLGPLMEDTNAGIVAPTDAAIGRSLGAWFDEFNRTGGVAWTGRPDRVAAYTRRAQTRKLADLLMSLTRSAA